MDRRTFLGFGAGLAYLLPNSIKGAELLGDIVSPVCEGLVKDTISQRYLAPVVFTGKEIPKIIEFDDKREIENKDPHHKKNFMLRQAIREKTLEKCTCFLFGNYLDGLAISMRNVLEAHIASNPCGENSQLPDFECDIEIPENFIASAMDLRMLINKKELTLYVYQQTESQEILLLQTLVALGGRGRDYSTGQVRSFPTPSGQFYLKRINERPWWYPPKWAREKKPKAPGPNNPYGLWMGELCRTNELCGYEFSPPGDAGIRVHLTNKPKSIGQYESHGCIRIPPGLEELFRAILHYTPHREPKTNGRGTIYPFDKVIPVQIVEK